MQKASKSDGSSTSEQNISDESESDISWISWFCSRQGNEFFCEVDEEFIKDEFNLTGLNTIIPHYRLALDTILDYESLDNIAVSHKKIEKCAEVLYGLIHSRFILSHQGMAYMKIKYKAGDFGKCPRFHCEEQNCLPTSTCDNINESHVLLYCPKCKETYYPRAAQHRLIDGAYFGTTFAHLFLLTHSQTNEASHSTKTSPINARIFMQNDIPLSIEHLTTFSSRREAYALLRKKISQNMILVLNHMTPEKQERCITDKEVSEDSITTYNSKYHDRKDSIQVPDTKVSSLGSLQVENDAILLIIDSLQKEKYMKKLLEKLQNLQEGFEACSSYELLKCICDTYNENIHKASGCSETHLSKNQLVEHISQYHCKGKSIITEALRIARVMQRKLLKDSNASFHSEKIRQAVTTRWISYNDEFRTIEDRFEKTVKHVIDVSDELSDNIHHVNFTMQPSACLQECKAAQSEWEILHTSCLHIKTEVDALSQDLSDLYASYRELTEIVSNQGTILDNIQHNIESSHESIVCGIKDVEYSTKKLSLCNIM